MNPQTAQSIISHFRSIRLTTTSGIAIIAVMIGLFNTAFGLAIYESMQSPTGLRGVLGISTMLADNGTNASATILPSNQVDLSVTPMRMPPISIPAVSPTNTSLTPSIEPTGSKIMPSFHFPTTSTIPNEPIINGSPITNNTKLNPSLTGLPTGAMNKTMLESTIKHLFVMTKNSQGQIDISAKGTHVVFDPSTQDISVQTPDGTKSVLNANTLVQINQVLQSKKLSIQKDSTSYSLDQNGTSASSNMKLSLDLSTQSIQLATPTGSKAVTFLPNDALQLLKSQKVIDSLSTSNTTSSQPLQLTVKNNEPVFQINGNSNKKLLGIVPVVISKMVTMSAQSGQVQSVQESTFQHILDAFSY